MMRRIRLSGDEICKRQYAGEVPVFSLSLDCEPSVLVQAIEGVGGTNGTRGDAFRIVFNREEGHFYVPWSLFVRLIERGEMSAGSVSGWALRGNSWAIQGRGKHKRYVDDEGKGAHGGRDNDGDVRASRKGARGDDRVEETCNGHDVRVDVSGAMVAEINEKMSWIYKQWRRRYGDESEERAWEPILRADFRLIEVGLRAVGIISRRGYAEGELPFSRDALIELLSCPSSSFALGGDMFEDDVAGADGECEEPNDEDDDVVDENDRGAEHHKGGQSHRVASPSPAQEAPEDLVVDDEDAKDEAYWRKRHEEMEAVAREAEMRAAEFAFAPPPLDDHPPCKPGCEFCIGADVNKLLGLSEETESEEGPLPHPPDCPCDDCDR